MANIDDMDTLSDAILSRHNKVFEAFLARADDILEVLEDLVIEEEEAPAEEEEALEGADTFERIKGEVEQKGSATEKAEAWLTKVRAEDGKTSSLKEATFFSRVSIVRLLKHVLTIASVSESSK